MQHYTWSGEMSCSIWSLLWRHNQSFLKQYFVSEKQFKSWASKKYPEVDDTFVHLPTKCIDYIQATRKKLKQ